MDLSKTRCLTLKYPGISNVIAGNVDISFPESLLAEGESALKITCIAIWDTGAMGSAITELTAQKLNLKPTGAKKVSGLGGTISKNTYLIDLMLLPTNILIKDLSVTELDNPINELGEKVDAFGILIGMDIIGAGDFCVTNFNGKTVMTFRIPSCIETDYVHEWNFKMDMQKKIQRNAHKKR